MPKAKSSKATPRVTPKERDDAIFRPKGEKVANVLNETTFYTMKGFSKEFDESKNYLCKENDSVVCAKVAVRSGNAKYFAMFDGHRFRDPSAPASKAAPGMPRWKYVEVNKQAFDSYLKFLRTRNDAHMTAALRNFF
jgi:hypothetical protein